MSEDSFITFCLLHTEVICLSFHLLAVSTLLFSSFTLFFMVITTQRYAKRGICRRRVSVRPSVCVCVCVCLSHSGIVSKRLNVGSRK